MIFSARLPAAKFFFVNKISLNKRISDPPHQMGGGLQNKNFIVCALTRDLYFYGKKD